MSSRLAVLGALLALAVPGPRALAQHLPAGAAPAPAPAGSPAEPGEEEVEALPCRPTIACTAEFVPAGYLEVEAGYTGRQLGGGFQHSTPVILKLTVLEPLQLQVGTNGWVAQRAESAYLDDFLVAAKLRLAREEGASPALAFSAGLSIPTRSGQQGYVPTYDAQLVAYASKDLGPIHADLNLALNVLDLQGAGIRQPWVALSVSTELAHRYIPMVEGYAFGSGGDLAASDHGLLVALGLAFTRQVVMDVGGDWGMIGQDRRFSLFVGLTVLTPRLWTP